ncbi:thioredoxin domain-containing protein 16 [Cyclopterus lumpus]|uniref:thioredoxin domain-containing protein 16 n=1 Tax=Cyclopterus lumpus TaxID=8103 RepID=UPI0014875310|nr:thioredoxin domain-containing protein 16 [Cyclopterus lumpus]XP_034409984.1 thioredoxin domain-containing protein 16 [Cyclopterus lumpus]XP_034409992.1 thioredoxin domain-containing protein 16 [Cyclopterus lumpus]XP_034410001.1 thioredoxin domain-containing protein 16 [Cyclopterus lumpus]XP_034410010.1 thioredoxin domain-containing protein 16 [Cyclopterus lumpus]
MTVIKYTGSFPTSPVKVLILEPFLEQSISSIMWSCIALSLLCMGLAGCTEKAATSALLEHTAADFNEKLHSGKTMFIYFQQQVSSTISLFLVELEQSADALKYYGVLVGKVNCNKEPVLGYCTEEKALNTAFLFRGGKEFLGFNLDTVFDVNSIVSEVLFSILREEIKYVHTESDLLAMEKAARGKKNIALGYVSNLGTPEHRSMMETAYVYGSKYQFSLITGGPVLNHLGLDEKSRSSQVWFLHCGAHSGSKTSEHCPSTRMSKPLSTLGIHSFLQLMEAPLVYEVYDDPSSVQSPQFPYQDTPQVFLFSRPATKQEDLDTATALAWRLRGLALLVLVHKQSPAVKTPDEYNAAYRLPEKGSEVKYLTSNSPDELLALFKNQEEEEEVDDDKPPRMNSEFHNLDDEIVVSAFENRLNLPDSDSLTQLTSDNFHATVAQSSLTVALFHLPWEAVSKTFLSSYIDVAERLEGSEVQMTVVNCAEWTDLCAAESGASPPFPFQPVTVFPAVLLLRPEESAQHYGGMLGTEALHRFIALSQPAFPAILSTQEEVTSFLQEVPHLGPAGYKPDRALGLFETQADAGVRPFIEAAKSLRGEVLTGLLTDGLAEKWAAQHNVDLPAVLAFPSWDTHTRPSALPSSTSAEEFLSRISNALLHPLPELTVENLPSFLSQGKGLLLLFVGEEEDEIGRRQNQALLDEMRGLVELGGQRMEPYLVCWIHLGRTPAGMSVLGSYLGSMPPLPALVLAHLPTGSEIYQYTPNTPIVASSVLQWVQRVEDGTDSAAGMLGGDSWPPASELLDFLKIMDMQVPEFRQQPAPKATVEKGAAVEKAGDPSSSKYTHTEL